MTPYLLTAAFSYLAGSIPFGYLLVRIVRGEDIRKSGSGNIGATNVSRKSPALGAATLVLDALKGFFPVVLTLMWARHTVQASSLMLATPEQAGTLEGVYALGAIAALFAILGHMFPVWLRFRGGKGVATGLGSWVALAPKSVLVMVLVFLVVLAAFRYVSLGSVSGAAVFPLAAWTLHDYHQSAIELTSMALSSLLIVAKHQKNIRRLLAGTESRLWQRSS